MITQMTYALTAVPAVFAMPSGALDVRDRHVNAGASKRHPGSRSWSRPESVTD